MFYRIRWLKRFMRRSLPNMKQDIAEKWHMRLSFLYFFTAWTTFGAILLMMKKGKMDYAEYYGLKTEQEASRSKAVIAMETLGIPKARIITFEGLTKVRDEDYESKVVLDQLEEYDEEIKALQK